MQETKKIKENKVDYSIEYAHIYSNENFDRQHMEASWLLNQRIKKLEKEGYSFNKVVLVDDYNPADDILDREFFIKQLSKSKAKPDYLGSEGRLVPLTDQVLEAVEDSRLRRGVERYIDSRGRVPCSFLIVIWYLLRMGLISNGVTYYRPVGETQESEKPFLGENLITILPERFRDAEAKAEEIIANSRYKEAINKIETVFF